MYILSTLIVLTTYKCPNKTHPIHQPRGLTRPEDEGRTKRWGSESESESERGRERDAREGLAEGGPHVISLMEVRGSGVSYNTGALMRVSAILSRNKSRLQRLTMTTRARP
jgi:hypothetical protein